MRNTATIFSCRTCLFPIVVLCLALVGQLKAERTFRQQTDETRSVSVADSSGKSDFGTEIRIASADEVIGSALGFGLNSRETLTEYVTELLFRGKVFRKLKRGESKCLLPVSFMGIISAKTDSGLFGFVRVNSSRANTAIVVGEPLTFECNLSGSPESAVPVQFYLRRHGSLSPIWVSRVSRLLREPIRVTDLEVLGCRPGDSLWLGIRCQNHRESEVSVVVDTNQTRLSYDLNAVRAIGLSAHHFFGHFEDIEAVLVKPPTGFESYSILGNLNTSFMVKQEDKFLGAWCGNEGPSGIYEALFVSSKIMNREFQFRTTPGIVALSAEHSRLRAVDGFVLKKPLHLSECVAVTLGLPIAASGFGKTEEVIVLKSTEQEGVFQFRFDLGRVLSESILRQSTVRLTDRNEGILDSYVLGELVSTSNQGIYSLAKNKSSRNNVVEIELPRAVRTTKIEFTTNRVRGGGETSLQSHEWHDPKLGLITLQIDRSCEFPVGIVTAGDAISLPVELARPGKYVFELLPIRGLTVSLQGTGISNIQDPFVVIEGDSVSSVAFLHSQYNNRMSDWATIHSLRRRTRMSKILVELDDMWKARIQGILPGTTRLYIGWRGSCRTHLVDVLEQLPANNRIDIDLDAVLGSLNTCEIGNSAEQELICINDCESIGGREALSFPRKFLERMCSVKIQPNGSANIVLGLGSWFGFDSAGRGRKLDRKEPSIAWEFDSGDLLDITSLLAQIADALDLESLGLTISLSCSRLIPDILSEALLEKSGLNLETERIVQYRKFTGRKLSRLIRAWSNQEYDIRWEYIQRFDDERCESFGVRRNRVLFESKRTLLLPRNKDKIRKTLKTLLSGKPLLSIESLEYWEND